MAPRRLVVDVSKSLPPRARSVSPESLADIFGGCVPFGQPCVSASECCQDRVPAGSYVLCYFYRSPRIVTGYCTYSAAVYGS
jgi:hypothetical protein